jgi:Rhs element Vgr protein
MSRVSGRAKCEGLAGVNPGDLASITGVGDRYSGKVFVSGVRHDFDMVQGWKTNLQFGSGGASAADGQSISSPPAGALLPAVHGLQIGIVTGNEDPDGEHRIRLRLPVVNNEDDGTWARVATLDAGDSRGTFFRPEIDDEVIVGFLDGDPRSAVVLGMLHSSAKPAPLQGSDENHEKVYQSRAGMKLYFNDDTKVLELETPAGNRITLSEQDKAVRLEDQNGSTIEMTPDGITIDSSKALTIKAASNLTLQSGAAFEVKGGSALKLAGTASAELSSAATTIVKGGLVQIN